MTIARGHLEVLGRANGSGSQEIEVALDELERIERILERLLLLAKADQPDFVVPDEIDVEPFLEDVFMRWSEVAPRNWRLGGLAPGTLRADPEALRIALDALLENAVKYTEPGDEIELSSRAEGEVVIEVDDEGVGVPPRRSIASSTASRAQTRRARGRRRRRARARDRRRDRRAHGGSCAAANSAKAVRSSRCASRATRRRGLPREAARVAGRRLHSASRP